jgi:hypothetical protein
MSESGPDDLHFSRSRTTLALSALLLIARLGAPDETAIDPIAGMHPATMEPMV